ncbi:MAG: tRNA 2-selenouridine(34) synthase MnmH [Bacteroidales bacterium]|nr:tRNA 2-selenouridine(34) synthase MnmH [Bacteroidales bacterium]
MNNTEAKTGPGNFLELARTLPVVDVRTPAEYLKGHIPGAVNIPLFSNDERAIVGTIYKQENQLAAIMKGLDIVGPKMTALLKQGIKAAGKKKKLLVHCWRGGSRSESMAWLFSNAGIKCVLLEGGYKSYRNYILDELKKPRKLIVVGGYTGSGKTAILHEMKAMGEQATDLEALAHHKGSAFGALGQEEQPSSEHFTNLLHDELKDNDRNQRLFVEDESHNIGSVNIPGEFFDLMKKSVVIALMPGIRTRMPRLLKDYGVFEPEQLVQSVKKITKRLGGRNTAKAIEAIRNNDLEPAIEIVLAYYDKAYAYGLSRRPQDNVMYIDSPSDNARENAGKIIELADNIKRDITVS